MDRHDLDLDDLTLDDLKNAWHLETARLGPTLRLAPALATGRLLDRAERALGWLAFALWGGVAVHAAVAVWLGSWLAGHVGEPRLFAVGLVVDVAAILLLVSRAAQIVALRSLDWTAPVVDLQRRIVMLRRARLRILQWTFLLSPLLWLPLTVVLVEALVGIDLLAGLPTSFVIANLLVGLAAIPAGLALSRYAARRLGGSTTGRRFLIGLAGPQLAAAEGFLMKLDTFEAPSPTEGKPNVS